MILKKQSSDALSSIAARVLKGGHATPAEIKALAASVLSQDETQGKRKNKRQQTTIVDIFWNVIQQLKERGSPTDPINSFSHPLNSITHPLKNITHPLKSVTHPLNSIANQNKGIEGARELRKLLDQYVC